MAVAQEKIADRPTLHSDLVKADFWKEHDYTREMKTLTVAEYSQTSPHGVEIGQVYADDGTILVAADVAGLATDGTTPIFLLVDDEVYFDGHADGASTKAYAVMKQGPAVVVREQLKFGDSLTSGQVDTVVSVLESQGIEVRQQV